MSYPYNILDWYWSVADSSPGTQVFSSASGAFVPLSNPTYTAWLAAGNAPTDIPTLAGLYGVFNAFNSTIVRSSYQAITPSADTTLTNPLPSLLLVTPTADNLKIILPPMNRPGSLALGQTFRIRNGASFGIRPFFVYYNDGTTKAWMTASGAGAVTGTEDIIFTSFNNTTASGQVIGASYLSISGGTVKGDLICGANTSLTIWGPSATLAMRKDSGQYNAIVGVNNSTGKVRWMMKLGDATAESGSNVGSDFALERHDDASTGTPLGTPLFIKRSTGAVTIQGTATNDSAAAGFVGEFIESSIPNASKISLTTATWATITSISLTAGDWDVWAVAQYDGGGTTTINALQATISTSGSPDFTQGRYAANLGGGVAGGLAFLPTVVLPPTRISLSATTTYNLNAAASFGTSTCQAYGRLMARRRR